MDKDGDVIIDEWVKVTCYDKQKALDSLTSMLGYDAPAKVEVEQTIRGGDHKVIFENYEDGQ